MKKTKGAITAAVGMGSLIGGALFIKDANNVGPDQDSNLTKTLLDTTIFALGTASIGVLIPMYIGGHKSRRKRDRLKESFERNRTDKIGVLQK